MTVCIVLHVVAVDQVVVVAGVAKSPPTGGTSITCGGEPLSGETLVRRGLAHCTAGLWEVSRDIRTAAQDVCWGGGGVSGVGGGSLEESFYALSQLVHLLFRSLAHPHGTVPRSIELVPGTDLVG